MPRLLAGTLLAAAGLLALSPAALAQEAAGTWLTEGGKARVRIAPCGSNLCGHIVWLKEPNDEAGKPKLDAKNADAAKRSRPLVGAPILMGMQRDGGQRWKGEIYNAEDGKTYTAFLTPAGANEVKIEGCVLGGLICKKQSWTRAR